jgi:hypothetical protein
MAPTLDFYQQQHPTKFVVQDEVNSGGYARIGPCDHELGRDGFPPEVLEATDQGLGFYDTAPDGFSSHPPA